MTEMQTQIAEEPTAKKLDEAKGSFIEESRKRMSPPLKRAILFKTHILNYAVLTEYKRLQRACRKSEVFFLVHSERTKRPVLEGIDPIFFSNAEIRSLNYPFRNMWWNGHYPVLYFFSKRQDFDYYWQIEYDLRFTGSWSDLLEPCEGFDFLGTDIYYEDGKPRQAAFPLVAFSQRALAYLHLQHQSGVDGYCEYVVPRLLWNAGMKLAKIDDLEIFTRHFFAEKVYDPDLCRHRKLPARFRQGFRRNKLYHPIYGFTWQWLKKNFDAETWKYYFLAVIRRLALLLATVMRIFNPMQVLKKNKTRVRRLPCIKF